MAQDPGQIRDEIAATRAELAETVQALAEKADVNSRVRKTLADKSAELQTRAGELGQRVRQVTPERTISGLRSARTKAWFRPAVGALLVGGLLFGRRLARSR